jgi:hypothetical protein
MAYAMWVFHARTMDKVEIRSCCKTHQRLAEGLATHMARTSFTSVGSEADSPAPLLRPSPATDHDAETLDVEDPDLGYNAETFPYRPPQRGMRPPCRAGLLSG